MLRFQYDCVNPKSIEELEFIIFNENVNEISLKDFKESVNRENFVSVIQYLGYGKDFKIEDDWHVQFFQSFKKDGQNVCYLVHSAIEYIFY